MADENLGFDLYSLLERLCEEATPVFESVMFIGGARALGHRGAWLHDD